jgi:tetrahydromethanopterin S-methyltransferase subunit B
MAKSDCLERTDMSQATIEERVTRLEQLVDQLLRAKPPSAQPDRDDWKRTFGMFAGDAVMKEIIEAGQRIREEDRAQAGP